jgi:hypothetical protein
MRARERESGEWGITDSARRLYLWTPAGQPASACCGLLAAKTVPAGPLGLGPTGRFQAPVRPCLSPKAIGHRPCTMHQAGLSQKKTGPPPAPYVLGSLVRRARRGCLLPSPRNWPLRCPLLSLPPATCHPAARPRCQVIPKAMRAANCQLAGARGGGQWSVVLGAELHQH